MTAIASPLAAQTNQGSRLVKIAIANVLGSVLWLAPLGILGLVYCFLAWHAKSNGDMARAEGRLKSATALARVSVYGGLALLIVGGIAIVFFMQPRALRSAASTRQRLASTIRERLATDMTRVGANDARRADAFTRRECSPQAIRSKSAAAPWPPRRCSRAGGRVRGWEIAVRPPQ